MQILKKKLFIYIFIWEWNELRQTFFDTKNTTATQNKAFLNFVISGDDDDGEHKLEWQ